MSPNILETDTETLSKYKEIIKANGITDEISEVTVNDAGLRGEGFASQSNIATVKFVNPNLKPLHLFVKSHTTNSSHSEMIDELKAFEKEARFYMEYVPAAKEFCRSKGLEGLLDMYPKCYYGDNKMIVFENVVLEKGYTLLPKDEMQNLDAATVAIQTLAKHHAISHAMIQNYGGSEKFFKKFPNLNYESFTRPAFRAMIEPALTNALNVNIQLLEKHAVKGRDDALAKCRPYVGRSFDILAENLDYNPDDEKLLLLNHGDYWNNNMMFLLDPDTQKVTGHVAIDLQVTRYNSPGLDLSYYLFTSVKPLVRRAHLEDLLRSYLETLQSTSKDLGYPIDLTYEDVLLMFRKRLNYGFWFGVCFTFGPGLNVIKEIDMNAIGEVKNFAEVINTLIQKWIDNNPEQCAELASSFVELMEEHDELTLREQ
ncbi:unnamed protein product [Orchesella dallaii]|uniref:CHK kinase-like domain-containing protein n=1 Tax=Orchesella dallaii TaxID=48710 RepID=A0ABP1R991_9HEXA